MATKNLFASMLNQKPATAPGLKGGVIKEQKAPGVSEFAFLGQGNSYRPMQKLGPDMAQSIWGRALNLKPKKGFTNG